MGRPLYLGAWGPLPLIALLAITTSAVLPAGLAVVLVNPKLAEPQSRAIRQLLARSRRGSRRPGGVNYQRPLSSRRNWERRLHGRYATSSHCIGGVVAAVLTMAFLLRMLRYGRFLGGCRRCLAIFYALYHWAIESSGAHRGWRLVVPVQRQPGDGAYGAACFCPRRCPCKYDHYTKHSFCIERRDSTFFRSGFCEDVAAVCLGALRRCLWLIVAFHDSVRRPLTPLN